MLIFIKRFYLGISESCRQINSSTSEMLHKIHLRCTRDGQPLDSIRDSFICAMVITFLKICIHIIMRFPLNIPRAALVVYMCLIAIVYVFHIYKSLYNLWYALSIVFFEIIIASYRDGTVRSILLSCENMIEYIFDIIYVIPMAQAAQSLETYNNIHTKYLDLGLVDQFLTNDTRFYEISIADIAKSINRYAAFLETKGITFDEYQCPISHTILSKPTQVNVNVQTQQGSETNSIYFNQQNIKKYVMLERQKQTTRPRPPVNCPMRRTPITNTSFTIDGGKQLQVFNQICSHMREENNRTFYLSNGQ